MLTSKTRLPVLRDALLARQRLLDVLSADPVPLVVVVGPAGSGKTVLVRQWVQRLADGGARIAWLTLDPRDNDPARFRAYVRDALAAVEPELAAGPDPGGPAVLPEVLRRAGAGGPLVLVLDDLQFLVEPAVLDDLAELVETIPDDVQLALLSRTRLPLRLARRRAVGGLVELGGQDLLFTAEETTRVLGTAADAAAVQRSTGGWPFAVGLTAGLAAAHDPVAADELVALPTTLSAATMKRTRRQIADYLTEEVLAAQPDPVQEFLLDTCVLDEITASAANAVRARTDAAAHLRHLEGHDVFLTPVDSGGEDAWRHHSLVRDHLRRQLEKRQPDRWTGLHRGAAQHYATRDLERAIGHALTAPDPDLAADLVERGLAGPAPLDDAAGMWQLIRWLEALPDEVFRGRAALRALGLSMAASALRHDLVERWLATRPEDTPAGLEELFAEAWQADSRGDLPRVRDACRRALLLCDPSSHWWRSLHAGLAEAEYALGDWAAAAVSYDLQPRPIHAGMTQWTGSGGETVRAFRVTCRVHAGRLDEAEQALAELTGWLSAVAPQGYRSVGPAAWAAALLAHARGDLTAAARWTDVPEDPWYEGQPLPPIVFRLDLARIRRASGDPAGAVELLADVRRRLAPFADPGRLPEWLADEEAALGVVPAPTLAPNEAAPAHGDAAGSADPLSQREHDVLRMLRSEYSLPEIATHLFVSYNTVKTHTRTIYRKLGASTRSQAVARARALGYL